MAILPRLTALAVVLALAACGGGPAGPVTGEVAGAVGASDPPGTPATGATTPADTRAPEVTTTPRATQDAASPQATQDATASPQPDPERQPEPEPPPAPVPAAAQASGMRAAWVHLFDGTLKSRASIAALVDELAAAGATAVIAQVARRHDAYYDSNVLPRTADPDLEPGLDVVAELTARAHAAGLEVHAWVSVAPTWHAVYEDLPAPAGWVPAEHGRLAPEAQRWVTRDHAGEWSEYLDPGLPQVREHVAAVAVELAGRYPVDGVHLDYVRYQSERHGYHPAALARYRQETGAAGTPAPGDPAWKAWRRQQTYDTVAHVRRALDGRDVALSAAVITWGSLPDAGGFGATRAANEALQEWPAWVRDGLVDAVMPMNYFRAADSQQATWFGQWLRYQQRLAADNDALVVPGIAGYLNTPEAALAQMHAAMRTADGAVMYSYQQPTEDGSRDIWQALERSRWGQQ